MPTRLAAPLQQVFHAFAQLAACSASGLACSHQCCGSGMHDILLATSQASCALRKCTDTQPAAAHAALRMGVPHGFTEPCIYSLHSSHVAHELTHCMSENDVITAGIQDCCPDHTSARFVDGCAVSWPNAAAGEEQRFGAHRMHACSHTCGRLR